MRWSYLIRSRCQALDIGCSWKATDRVVRIRAVSTGPMPGSRVVLELKASLGSCSGPDQGPLVSLEESDVWANPGRVPDHD